MNGFTEYLGGRVEVMLHRGHILDMFTFQPGRPVYPAKPELEGGVVFVKVPTNPDAATYGYYDGDNFIKLARSKYNPSAPFSIHDELEAPAGSLVNLKSKTTTTVGRFFTNYVLLVAPFGDAIPYINGKFNLKKLEAELGQLALDYKITTTQYKQYVTNGYTIGHLGDLFVPSLSPKGITIDKKIIARRDELLEKHKDELSNPKVVAAIEAELIASYREYIKGDPAEAYFDAIGEKALTNHIKTMHIMVGAMTDFGGTGDDIVTITKSLEEGWDKNNFPTIANGIRRGSHSRGSKTQDGGTLTKRIFRALMDVRLAGDDCKTKRSVEITFNDSITPDMFLGRTIIKGETTVELTSSNAMSYAGKTVRLRSPMTCASKESICYTCVGQNFKKLNITHPGTLAIDISSTFMLAEMKSFHNSTIAVREFDHTDYFVN